MQYRKLKSGNTIIEFHNSWVGEETVIANGQVVSRKSSIWGTNHYFSVMENGRNIRYVLTSRINAGFQVTVDLTRNGKRIFEDVLVPYGTRPRKPYNHAKKEGFQKLKKYELEEALIDLKKALDLDSRDPEIYFHMACAYSVLEKTREGFDCLKLAVELGLKDHDVIITHDMLAFLRLNDAFEDFLNSGFTEYDEKLLRESEEEHRNEN